MNIFREYDCYFNSPEKLFILNLDCTKQISENNRRINKKLFGMGKKPNPLFVRVTCMYNFAILKPHLSGDWNYAQIPPFNSSVIGQDKSFRPVL